MALLVRTRPIFGPLLRSLLSNTTRTFTGRTQVVCPLRPEISIRHQSGFDIVKSSQHQPTLLSSIRLVSSGEPAEVGEPEYRSVSSDDYKTFPSSISSSGVRALDRNFASFEERCQRFERVSEKEFVKLFDLFTRIIQGFGDNVNQLDPYTVSNIVLYTNILIRCCGRLMFETPSKARELLAGNLWTFVKEKSIPLDISHYNSLLRVMNENGTNYDPKKILDEIESSNLKTDRITYQRLIHQYCLQGDMSNATQLLEKMKDLGFELNESIFASLIIGYSKQENSPSYREMFDLMQSNNIEPDSNSYCASFVSLASKLDNNPQAIEQFDQLSNLFKKDDIQLSTNDIVDITLSLLPFKKKYEVVEKFLADIPTLLSTSIGARYRFLTTLLQANEFEQASKVYWSQKVSERALRLQNSGIYWIKAMSSNHNVPIEFAMNECKKMKDQGHFSKPYHQLFYSSAEIGRLDLVRATLKAITEIEPLKIHFIWPLIAQAKNEDELIQTLKYDLDPLMDSNDLMETFSNWVWPKFADDPQRLFELNNELKFDNNVLMASFLNYSVQENKFMEAVKFISEAPQDLVNDTAQDVSRKQDIEDETNEVDVQGRLRVSRSGDRGNLVARLLNQIVDHSKDVELVKKAFNICRVPGQPVSTRSLAALIRVHILNGDYDSAIEEFLRITRENRVAPCRAELMRHCLETKNPDALQKIMNSLIEIFGEQNALFDLSISCLKSGKLKQAQKIFASPGFRVRPVRVYQTCRSLARQDNVEALENLINLARDMYDVNQEYLYQLLIDTYERTSNAKRALRLWNMMQEEDFQPSKRSLLMIANVLERNQIEVPFQKPKLNLGDHESSKEAQV